MRPPLPCGTCWRWPPSSAWTWCCAHRRPEPAGAQGSPGSGPRCKPTRSRTKERIVWVSPIVRLYLGCLCSAVCCCPVLFGGAAARVAACPVAGCPELAASAGNQAAPVPTSRLASCLADALWNSAADPAEHFPAVCSQLILSPERQLAAAFLEYSRLGVVSVPGGVPCLQVIEQPGSQPLTPRPGTIEPSRRLDADPPSSRGRSLLLFFSKHPPDAVRPVIPVDEHPARLCHALSLPGCDPLLRRPVCAAGQPANTQVSRCITPSGSDREFPALAGRSGTQRARPLLRRFRWLVGYPYTRGPLEWGRSGIELPSSNCCRSGDRRAAYCVPSAPLSRSRRQHGCSEPRRWMTDWASRRSLRRACHHGLLAIEAASPLLNAHPSPGDILSHRVE